MAKFDDGVNNVTVFDADKLNNINRALKDNIESSGQTIDASNTQSSKALANYVGSANFYTDSGVADAYVLSTTGSFKAPTPLIDGLEIRFRTSNPNSGASTINVAGLGVVNIKLGDGTSDIPSGFITSGSDVRLRYDASNTAFIPSSSVILSTTSSVGSSYLPNPITISNGTDADHDIDFTAGNFNFDDGSGQAIATALTKQIDASWVAGDNAGGLDTGSVAIDTTYYCFVIWNPTTSTADFLFSTSSSSPTMPSGYTKKKRVASLLTDGSSNIRSGNYTFFTGGYRFIYSVGLLVGIGLTPAYSDLPVPCPPFSLTLIDGDLVNNSTASYTKFQVGSKIEGDGIFSGVISQNVNSRTAITPPFPIKVDSNSDISSGFVDGIACAYTLYVNGYIEYL